VKDSQALHLYVRDIRILTPREYQALRSAIPKDSHKTIFDIFLITGMRYAELLRLYDNPAWYNEKKNLIHLSQEAQKKHKRRQLENYSLITVIHQLDQKIIYPHYDFKHLTEKYFEIGMKLNDFSIQLVKYYITTVCLVIS